ncbi:MAG: type II toxin-antitoxin system Phd/YefM family antitoxin [Planctomycetota bacterium]|jgi:prevent-host-death family protein
MKFVALRELKIHPSKVLDRLRRHDVVVTRNGKPAAALVPLDEDTLDEFIIAHHPTLLPEVEAARAEFEKKGGVSHDEMKALVEGKKGKARPKRRKGRRRG